MSGIHMISFFWIENVTSTYRHLARGENGEKSSTLQPFEPNLVGAGVGRQESAFMIAEEIRGKVL